MAYRSIIVNLDIDGPAVNLIQAATDLALRFNARLIGLSSADVPPPVTAANGVALDGDSARLQCEDIDRRLVTLREGFIDLVGKEVEAGWCSGIGNPTRFLVDAARSADLIVTASPLKPYFGCTYRRVDLGGLVLDAGRPVLVCVNDVERVLARTVMVAWKDTREARRAVADAIPLLSLARDVVIVTIEREADFTCQREGYRGGGISGSPWHQGPDRSHRGKRRKRAALQGGEIASCRHHRIRCLRP